MNYRQYNLENDIILIRDEEDNTLYMKYYGDVVRILRTDESSNLIKAAEMAAYFRGKERMLIDFYSDQTELKELLEQNGYGMVSDKRVLSVVSSELFVSKGVKKSINIDFPVAHFYPLSDLMSLQLDELVDVCGQHRIPITHKDVERLDQDLSGVVYDDHSRVQAFILASEYGNEALVEFLFGLSKDKPQFIMSALQGFAKQFQKYEFGDIYSSIAMLEINPSITPLLKRLLDKEYSLSVEGQIVQASKRLSDACIVSNLEISEAAPSDESDTTLPVHRSLFEDNINWKMQWDLNNSKK